MLHDLLGDRFHDPEVHVQQVVSAHPWLPRHAGRDHDHIRVGRLRVVGPANDAAVGTGDRARLEHVERDARGLRVGDIDDDDVGEFLVGDTAGDGRADIARAPHHGHFAIHSGSSKRSISERAEHAK
jgi:hypothetical protein